VTDSDRMAALIGTARQALRDEIQPLLPAEQRYTTAMIANALAIASRTMASGTEIAARMHAALAGLYPDRPDDPSSRLERRLAQELRAGNIEPERERCIRAVLVARTLARLSLTNPDYPKSHSE